MARLTGMTYVLINGQRLRSKPGASLKPGGAIQKAQTDAYGFAGHATEEIKPAEIKCTLLHDDSTDVTALQQIRGATAIFESDSGQRYLVREAGTEDEIEWKGKEVELTLTGAPAERI